MTGMQGCLNLESFVERWRETDYDDLVIEKGLRDAAIFRVLPNQARSQLRGNCKLLCFNTGDTVIKQGTDDVDEAMYIIVYGTVGVYIGTNPEAVTFMSSGRFFGEMGLLTGALRTASIKAEETCKLIQVTRTALAPLIEAMPQLADQIAEVITMRRSALTLSIVSLFPLLVLPYSLLFFFLCSCPPLPLSISSSLSSAFRKELSKKVKMFFIPLLCFPSLIPTSPFSSSSS